MIIIKSCLYSQGAARVPVISCVSVGNENKQDFESLPRFPLSGASDFSSAFNKVQPHILIERLASRFMLPDQILLMILNFFNRLQQVFVNGRKSSLRV